MLTCYLAGPIRGLPYTQAIGWRIDAAKRLKDVGIKCLSPMRSKELIKDVEKITDSYDDMKGYSSSEIFARDRFDIKMSDILLFNFLNRKAILIGTLFELAWGYMSGKYCVLVVGEDSIYAKHPFIKESASITFDNLNDAIDHIGEVYGSNNLE